LYSPPTTAISSPPAAATFTPGTVGADGQGVALFFHCVLFYYKNFLLPDAAWKQNELVLF
jgi:hypothetical protein